MGKGDEKKATNSGDKKLKPPRKSGKEAAKEAVEDLLVDNGEEGDDLIMLKKLISEGRISGLDEKPPSFKPPTPPSKTASSTRKIGGSNGAPATRSNSSPKSSPDV